MGPSRREHLVNRSLIVVMAVVLLSASPEVGATAERSFFQLTTGNGHGFQIFDREKGRITTFLEHPHRFVAPTDESRTAGVSRRDLAHDVYAGIRVDGKTHWLVKPTVVGYLDQSHVIRARSVIGALTIDVHYLAPFGYPGNAMWMILRVANVGLRDGRGHPLFEAQPEAGALHGQSMGAIGPL